MIEAVAFAVVAFPVARLAVRIARYMGVIIGVAVLAALQE